jgi:hypothetical protein
VVYIRKWINQGNQSLRRLILALIIVFAYLMISTSAHYFTHNTDLGDSLWWSVKHLIDPGFIDDDPPFEELKFVNGVQQETRVEKEFRTKNLISALVGTLFTVIGMLIFVFIFMGLVYDRGRSWLNRAVDGSLPKNIKNHLMVIGDSSNLLPFAHSSPKTLRRQYEVGDVALIVTDKGGLKRLRKIEVNHLNTYEISFDDIQHQNTSLQAQSAKEIIILQGADRSISSITHFINKIIEERRELFEKIEKRRRKRRPPSLKLTIEVNSLGAEKILHRLFNIDALKKIYINFNLIETPQFKARMLLIDHPLDHASTTRLAKREPPELIIDGWSEFALALVIQAKAFGLYAKGVTKIIILTRSTKEREAMDNHLISIFSSGSSADAGDDDRGAKYKKTLGFNREEISVEERSDFMLKFNPKSSSRTIAICGDDADSVMERATEWDHRVDDDDEESNQSSSPKHHTRIFIELRDDSSFGALIEKEEREDSKIVTTLSRMDLFILINESDLMPQIAHQFYLKMLNDHGWRSKRDRRGRYKTPTHNEWVDLPQRVKDWNRSTCDHISIKARLIANEYDLPHPVLNRDMTIDHLKTPRESIDRLNDFVRIYNEYRAEKREIEDEVKAYLKAQEAELGELDPDELKERLKPIRDEKNNEKNQRQEELFKNKYKELEEMRFLEELSEMEHDRWSSERFAEGWSHGSDRNDKRTIHHNLIPYNKLSHQDKDKDRDQIISQLENVLKSRSELDQALRSTSVSGQV